MRNGMFRKNKPILATAALRQLSPRKTIGTPYYNGSRANNMYHAICNPSPVQSESGFRNRTNLVKRKNSDCQGPSYASVVTLAVQVIDNDPVFDEETVEHLNVEITKVNSLCDKVKDDIVEVNIPPGLLSIVTDLSNAISMVAKVQAAIVKKVNEKRVSKTPVVAQNTMVSLGAISKRVRQEYGPQLGPQLPPPPPPPGIARGGYRQLQLDLTGRQEKTARQVRSALLATALQSNLR
jgi:hypothetical protein